MRYKRKKLKNKRVALIFIGVLLCVAILPLRAVRNGICKYTGYTICVNTDFGPSRYDANLYYKSLEEKKATDDRVGMQKYMDSVGETKRPLNEVCEDLSEELSKDYRPIVGKYLGSESYTYFPPSHSKSDRVGHRMVLEVDGDKISVGFSVEMTKKESLYSVLNEVVGEDVIKQKKNTDELYGICATENIKGPRSGKMETLRKVGKYPKATLIKDYF